MSESKRVLFAGQGFSILLPEQGVTRGHVVVVPEKNATEFSHLRSEEVQALFAVANTVSTLLFEKLGAQGTNLIANEGERGVSIAVIPRSANDGANLLWQPKQGSPEELKAVAEKIREKTFFIGKEDAGGGSSSVKGTPEGRDTGVQEKKEKAHGEMVIRGEDNELVRALRRIA
ncbi:HIT domain-containing protein [Candidatus Woesearchaeota archaeon]|nr:MAG: HIT domain-containing protein [Candidatus Woesearchaeota archaeon]